jgi:hypothetical protein
MKNFGADNTTNRRAHYCPECNKQRLVTPIDHVPSKDKREFDLPDGTKIELFQEVCEFCVRKYFRKYFEPKKTDVKKIMRALSDEHELPEDTSLEELL